MNLFFPHGNRVLQSPMHALAAEQSDAEAEERAGLRPWRMGAVGCTAAKAPGRARRKGSNGRDGLASCMATTRRKRKPHGQMRVAQCESFNCSFGKWALRRGDRVMADLRPGRFRRICGQGVNRLFVLRWLAAFCRVPKSLSYPASFSNDCPNNGLFTNSVGTATLKTQPCRRLPPVNPGL